MSALVCASMRVKRTSMPARPGSASGTTFCTEPSPRMSRVPSASTSSKETGVPSGRVDLVATKSPPAATLAP